MNCLNDIRYASLPSSILPARNPLFLPSPPEYRGRGVGGEGAGLRFAKRQPPSPPAPLPLSTGGEGRKTPIVRAPGRQKLAHPTMLKLLTTMSNGSVLIDPDDAST